MMLMMITTTTTIIIIIIIIIITRLGVGSNTCICSPVPKTIPGRV
jgi:hypothetical protein